MQQTNTINPAWLKAQMMERKIISFSIFQTMAIEINNESKVILLKVEKAIDEKSINRKQCALEELSENIGMKFNIEVVGA